MGNFIGRMLALSRECRISSEQWKEILGDLSLWQKDDIDAWIVTRLEASNHIYDETIKELNCDSGTVQQIIDNLISRLESFELGQSIALSAASSVKEILTFSLKSKLKACVLMKCFPSLLLKSLGKDGW